MKGIHGNENDSRVSVNDFLRVASFNGGENRWLMKVGEICQIINAVLFIECDEIEHKSPSQMERTRIGGLSSGGRSE